MRSLLMAVLFGFFLVEPQIVVSQNSLQVVQERGEAARDKTGRIADKRRISDATERLRQTVNGKALVRNHCQSKGRDFRVEESTEIVQISGCNLVLTTRKTTTSQDGQRELEFTVRADLADLTTPSSVEPQNFSQCKPVEGAVLKVMSRAQPGKALQASRRLNSESASATSKVKVEEPEIQTSRSDLSFFFPDPVTARKAARALDQALKVCGGKEWPDEDDLP
jgi:hypothetical protein